MLAVIFWWPLQTVWIQIRTDKMSSNDNLCKQFGPRSGPTKCRFWSGSKLVDTLIVFRKVNFEKVSRRQQKAWEITQHAVLNDNNVLAHVVLVLVLSDSQVSEKPAQLHSLTKIITARICKLRTFDPLDSCTCKFKDNLCICSKDQNAMVWPKWCAKCAWSVSFWLIADWSANSDILINRWPNPVLYLTLKDNEIVMFPY